MGRRGGGRSSGGGGLRSYRSSAPSGNRKAPPPAARNKAGGAPAAAAPASSGSSSVVSHVASSIAEGWLWGTGSAMAHRAMDAIMGPRKFEIEHTTTAATASSSSSSSSPCDVHAQAFQDCINHNGSDISRCQFYVDVLNDCRRRGQAAIVEASG